MLISQVYDPAGNVLELQQNLGPGTVVTTYTYNTANELETAQQGSVTTQYTYDANGSLISDGVKTYTYTSNKLSSISGENLNVTFQDRCNGLSSDQWGIIGCDSDRISQTVNGVTTNYVLDIASPLTQVLQEGTNTYVYGVDRIAQISGATPEYFLTDGLGSVRQLVDSTGAVTLAKSYEPYGETISSAGSGVSVYQFTGEARDVSGLTYLRARYLDSSVGRFISRDTWAGNYSRPLSLNRWNYVDSNPINRVDPTGKCWYQSASDFSINYNPLEHPFNGPCSWFVEIAAQAGISLSSNAAPQDVLSDIAVATFMPPTTITLPSDYWQVLKFTFDLGWEVHQSMTFGGSLHPTIPTQIGPVIPGIDVSCDEFGDGCDLLLYGAYGISDVLCGGIGLNIGYSNSKGRNTSLGLYYQIGEVDHYLTTGQSSTSTPVLPFNGLPGYASGGQSVQVVKERIYKDIFVLTTKTIINDHSRGVDYIARSVQPGDFEIIAWKVLSTSSNRELLFNAYSRFGLQEVTQ